MKYPIALIVVNFEICTSTKHNFFTRTDAFNWLKAELNMSSGELHQLELTTQWEKDYIHIYLIEWVLEN